MLRSVVGWVLSDFDAVLFGGWGRVVERVAVVLS
jgi:hypothetical protein